MQRPRSRPDRHYRRIERTVIGCLVAGLLVILLFVVVPWPLWPFLVIALIVVFAVAAALGLFKGILGTIFRR
jgi:hypothetical protein